MNAMFGLPLSNAASAEHRFPIQLRVAVPPRGFGRQLDLISGWLDEHVGRDAYCIHSKAGSGNIDVAMFYFVDTASAHAFVERFACGVVLGKRDSRRRTE
jgi:hypothetical protein